MSGTQPTALPEPFAYPQEPHRRRHGPAGYEDYGHYKPWLRDEFTFRCAYCLERETWYPSRAASFSADHFIPVVLDPDREWDYGNLVYACTRCNSAKSALIPLLDPTVSAFGAHVQVAADGAIAALTPQGQQLIDLFHLDKPPAREVREEYLLLLRAKKEHPDNPTIHALFLRKFGYPTDLPDLRKLRPPGGNAKKSSEDTCCQARRERGELPEYY
jgi:hypothetical protein